MANVIFLDIETFSTVDLLKCGVYKYVECPEFDILLAAVSANKMPPVCYDLTIPHEKQTFIDIVVPLLSQDAIIKKAANAEFEWVCLSTWLAKNGLYGGMLPVNQWRDTFLLALYCGFPANLAKLGDALGLGEDKKKMSIGKTLIRTFCTPRKPTKRDFRTRVFPKDAPEKWDLFKTYCVGDVVAEMSAEEAMQPIQVPDVVQHEWELQLLQNAKGVAVDMDLVEGALDINDRNTEELMNEAARLTGIDNPRSRNQLLTWLTKELGENEVPDLTKGTVANLLKIDNPGDVNRVLEIRQEVGKAALKKYQAIHNRANGDGRIRGLLQFYGASRTGRWAGRGVQLQNLARTDLDCLDLAREFTRNRNLDALRLVYGNVSDTLGQLVRTALIPTQDHSFVDADFSAIEARVIAWLAGEEWVLEVFRTHGKIYEATASQMFGVPLDLIKKGNPEYKYRQQGKTASLACSFAGGANALSAMDFNNEIPDEDKPGLVKMWRKANPSIVKLWYDLENAAIGAITSGTPKRAGHIVYEYTHINAMPMLLAHLPSGRHLSYPDPKIGPGRYGKPCVSSMAIDNGQWVRKDSFAGVLAENVTQAVARDVLAAKLTALADLGETAVFSVHDEVVLEQPKGSENLERICDILSTPIDWAPGLPLNAAGWIGDYYTKD